MKKLAFLICCLAYCFSTKIIAADIASQVEQPPTIENLQDELVAVKKELNELKTSVDVLKLAVNEWGKSFPGLVNLTPASEGFSVLNPGVGQITVSFLSIKPHASGSEITIGVVNLASATLTDVKFSGWAYPIGGKGNESETIRPVYKGKSGFTLPPGKEVIVKIRIPLISPDKFERVLIQAFVEGISYKAAK